ncbi:hypothetical protein Tco_1458240 [Tanacetum coccineum]
MAAATEALIVAVADLLPSSPPPSILTPLLSSFPQIPSPPLPLPSPPLPLPAPLSPLLLPAIDSREDVLEADVPPRKRLCLTALTPRFEVGESSLAVIDRQPGLDVTPATDYSFVDTMDATLGCPIAPTTLEELSQRVTELATTLTRDTHEMAVHAELLAYPEEVRALHEQINKSAKENRPQQPHHTITDATIKALIAQGVADALAGHEATKNSGNGDNSHEVLKELLNALTWWNSHVKTIGHDAAYDMQWKTLKKMMIDKYCPRCEIKKLEIELWNLKVKGIDVLSNNQCFQELALYDAIEFETELMDQKICNFADRQAKNKRKLDDNSRNKQESNNNPSKSRMLPGPTLLGLVRRKCTDDLNLCASNATTITMGSVLPSATMARDLAIWPGHYKKDCPKQRITTVETKLGTVEQQQGLMQWEIQGKTWMPMSLRKTEGNVGEKRQEECPICSRLFPKYFLMDFPVISTNSQMEFQIDYWYLVGYIFGAAPVARAPYRLAPSEMKELSDQLQELIRQRLYKTQFLTLGSSGLVCQEEGYIIPDVHRLFGT